MPNNAIARQSYSEVEAASFLGISLSELYNLLDEHVFTDGPRPEKLEFRYSDLLMLTAWSSNSSKVVRMPRRN
jgi:hypothetical protein